MNAKELVLIAVGVIMIFIGTYLFSTLGPHLEAIESGELIPFKVDDQKPFDVQMGGIHFIVTVEQLSKGYDFQNAVYFEGFDYPFKIGYKNEKLLVFAEIRNTDGDVVAKIADNQWSVNFNPIVTCDRNYNSYAFEAIDSDNVPVLQLVMTSDNTIFVGGVFYGENVTLVAMLNGSSIFNPSDNSYTQRIFQYPSDRSLGKLVANSSYAFGNQVLLAPTEIVISGYVLFGIGTFITLVGSVDSFKNKRKRSK